MPSFVFPFTDILPRPKLRTLADDGGVDILYRVAGAAKLVDDAPEKFA